MVSLIKSGYWRAGFGNSGRGISLPPANTVAPVVSGTTTEGQTLSCTTGTWDGSPTFTYQWYTSPSTAISGATNPTYVLQTSDDYTSILCKVTGTNSGGSVVANSNTVGAIVPIFPSGIPAAATAFGFNQVGFLDHFLSTDDIDLNNTLANGFTWYNTVLNFGTVGPPIAASDITASNSILRLLPLTAPAGGAQIVTAGWNPVPNSTVAANSCILKGSSGFYFEVRCQFNRPAVSFGLSVWLEDVIGITHQVNQTNTSQTFAEIDVVEGLAASTNYQQVLHEWTNYNSNNQTIIATGAATDMSQFHTWGALIVPAALNGGTGLARMYLDRVQVGVDKTWTPGGAYSSLENTNYVMIFDSMINLALNIDYIAVATPGVAPVSVLAPVATGTLSVGNTFTVTTGIWSGDALITYAYQWFQGSGSAILGATNRTYVVQAGDITPGIYCRVTATNFAGTASANSNGAAAADFLARTSGLDATHTAAYTALINGLVTDGVWQLLDALWITATQDTVTAKLNLVSSSFPLTEVGTGTPLTFTADRGYINPGPSAANSRYLATGFNPATASSPKHTQNSSHLSAWSALSTTATDANAIFGGNSAVGNFESTNIYPKYIDSNAYYRCNDVNPPSGGFANSNRQGLHVANRSSSTARQGYLNGVATSTPTPITSAAPNSVVLNLLTNSVGTACNITDTVAAASIGADISAVQSAFYTRLRAYMTAVGVP